MKANPLLPTIAAAALCAATASADKAPADPLAMRLPAAVAPGGTLPLMPT